MTPEYSRREQRFWYLYDWANSGYATIVMAMLLGPYLSSIAQAAADASGHVYPLGIPSFFPYSVGFTVAIQALILPLVGAITDFRSRKREGAGDVRDHRICGNGCDVPASSGRLSTRRAAADFVLLLRRVAGGIRSLRRIVEVLAATGPERVAIS